MGKKSVTSVSAAAVRKSSPIGSSEEMWTKYDKFAELQRRRKALESTSDENLSTTTLQRHSIEDSLRRSVSSHATIQRQNVKTFQLSVCSEPENNVIVIRG